MKYATIRRLLAIAHFLAQCVILLTMELGILLMLLL